MACLCCSIGDTTDGREMTVGNRSEVVYCGPGGELKDGGPVFIYKYPYSCVLSCKLCWNWEEQGCVLRLKRWGSKYNLKDSSATEMSREWVPYVWRCDYGSRSRSYQCWAESAVNHHQTDVETTSPLGPRWGGAVVKVNYSLVKNVTLSAVAKKSVWIWTLSPQRDENI